MKAMRPTWVTVLLSGAAVLGYLGYRTLVAPEPVVTEEPSAAAAASAALADSLPDLALVGLDGEPTLIASWAGQPMLINFWATWCAPCLREIPLLKQFQSDHEDIRVVGIAVDNFDPVQSFAAEMQFNYPVLVGQTDAMEAAAALGVTVLALPITVFTDSAGAVLGIHTGEIHAEHLEDYRAVLADLGTGRADREAARARLAARM